MDNLVQFEEDSNSRTKKWVVRSGMDRLPQTTPIPRSPDGDINGIYLSLCSLGHQHLLARCKLIFVRPHT